MRRLKWIFTRLSNFITKRSGDERLREEIESHITAQTQENIRNGMSREEATRQARLKFGTVATALENYNAEVGLPFLETILADIRFAFRVLQKSSAFTVVPPSPVASLAIVVRAV
jgi:hypothetical protein